MRRCSQQTQGKPVFPCRLIAAQSCFGFISVSPQVEKALCVELRRSLWFIMAQSSLCDQTWLVPPGLNQMFIGNSFNPPRHMHLLTLRLFLAFCLSTFLYIISEGELEGWTQEQYRTLKKIKIKNPHKKYMIENRVCMCVFVCSANQYIHHYDSPAWLACHWPTVLDAERWLGNCSLAQDFPLESWEPCWIIKPTLAQTLFVELHPVVLANQGPHNWRCRVSDWAGDVDGSGVVCLCVGRCLWWLCNFFCWLASAM